MRAVGDLCVFCREAARKATPSTRRHRGRIAPAAERAEALTAMLTEIGAAVVERRTDPDRAEQAVLGDARVCDPVAFV